MQKITYTFSGLSVHYMKQKSLDLNPRMTRSINRNHGGDIVNFKTVRLGMEFDTSLFVIGNRWNPARKRIKLEQVNSPSKSIKSTCHD